MLEGSFGDWSFINPKLHYILLHNIEYMLCTQKYHKSVTHFSVQRQATLMTLSVAVPECHMMNDVPERMYIIYFSTASKVCWQREASGIQGE